MGASAAVVLLLLCCGASGVRRPKASTLEEWIDGLTLEIEVDYKEKFSGITVEVDDVECEDIEMDIIIARYEAPRTLVLDLDDLNANCKGDYDWSYKTGIGKVKGDGKVEAKVRNSRVEVDLEVIVDQKGAPLRVEVEDCKATLKITDIDTRGDALGAALNPFVDSFADFFKDDIERVVCDSIQDQKWDHIDRLLQNAGFGNCLEDQQQQQQKTPLHQNNGSSTSLAPKNNDVVLADWNDVLRNASGPGADVVAALYKAASRPSASDIVAFLLDAAAEFDVPLASDEALEVAELKLVKMSDDKSSLTDLLANLSVSLLNASIASSVGSLGANVPRKHVDAYALSEREQIAAGLKLPSKVAFNASSAVDVTFGINYLADWIDQAKTAPVLRLRADVGLDAHDVGVDVVVAVGVDPAKTREGLNRLSLGDVVEVPCLKSAANLVEFAVPSLSIDYRRSKLRVANPRFVRSDGVSLTNVNTLEVKIARSVLPAVIDLVDLGLTDFVACVVDELVETDAAETLTDEARRYFGVDDKAKEKNRQQCASRAEDVSLEFEEDLDARLVDLSSNRIMKQIARQLKDFDATELAETLAETVAEGDVRSKYKEYFSPKEEEERRLLEEEKEEEETARSRFVRSATSGDLEDHVIVVAKNAADKIRIGPIGTTLRIRDVFIANLDRAIDNVTLVPGGVDALGGGGAFGGGGGGGEEKQRINLLAENTVLATDPEVPLVAGLSLSVETPVGDAEIALNVSFKRISVDDLFVDVYLDEPSVNGMNVGKDLGLSTFFTKSAKFPLPSCLAATLQAVAVPRLPKIHVGAVGFRAWSDVEGLDVVAVATAKAAVALVRDFVTTAAARDELRWLLNDAIENQVATAKKTCEKLVGGPDNKVDTAPRRDARGERPSTLDRDDSDGVSGDLALAADAFSVFVVVAVMFGTFGLIWLQRKHKTRAKRALHSFLLWRKTEKNKNNVRSKDDTDAASYAEAYVGGVVFSEEEESGVSPPNEGRSPPRSSSSEKRWAPPRSSENSEGWFSSEEEGASSGKEVAKDTDQAPRRHRALIAEAPVPFVVRYGLLAIMVGNVGLLITSNIQIAAQARIRLRLELDGAGSETIWLGTDSKFSLIESVTQLWEAGSLLLAILVASLSGAWPYVEIGLLCWGYVTPGIDPKRREWVWRSVEMLSKWSFIDVFIVVFLIVAFHIDVDLRTSTARARAELFVEARYAFYAFCFATLTSMCLGQIVLYLHREVHHLGRSRFRALARRSDELSHAERPDVVAPTNLTTQKKVATTTTKRADDDDEATTTKGAKDDEADFPAGSSSETQIIRRSLACHPLHGRPPRRWQRLVGPALLSVAGLLAASLAARAVVFEVGGAAGFLIDITDGSDRRTGFSAPGIPLALRDASPNDGWRPLIRVLEGIVLVFAFAIPAFHVALLGLLWCVPLAAPTQVRLLSLADVAYGWSSLDVFVVTILATATQINKLSEELAKDQCRAIDGYIAAFFDQAIDGDATCFTLSVRVRPGCVLLAVACAAQMILGYLTASVTTAAVAERVVQTALGRPNDASIIIRGDDDGGDDGALGGGKKEGGDIELVVSPPLVLRVDDDDDDKGEQKWTTDESL